MTPSTSWKGVIEHYRARLPVSTATPVVSLLEGNTPLIPAPNLARHLGGDLQIYLKFEGMNPTSSFKDRGMTLAMSKAAERHAQVVVCASTGNTSAAAAAYAARANLKALVLLPAQGIALGKLAQALMYGASIVAIDGNFDDALRIVRDLGERPEIEVVNSINPVRIDGQKTAAFEICDALGRAPDYHFLPVGNAGNITAYWKGFCEYYSDKVISNRPKMVGFQAAGAAPLVLHRRVEKPETVATAIRIGNPASWKGAEAAAAESGGFIDKVEDEEIIQAYQLAAKLEGVFVEPASAAPIAGLLRAVKDGRVEPGSVVTLTMTGHGLKDPDRAIKTVGHQPQVVPAQTEAVLKVLGF